MLEQLTNKQTSRLDEFVQRWTDIALNTDPSNESRAETACRSAYENVDLPPPKLILWVDSPLSLNLATRKLTTTKGKKGDVAFAQVDSDRFSKSLRTHVDSAIGTHKGKNMGQEIGNSIANRPFHDVAAFLIGRKNKMDLAVSYEVRELVLSKVRKPVSAIVHTSISRFLYPESIWNLVPVMKGASPHIGFNGQFDAEVLAYYSFFLEACESKACEKLLPLLTLGEEAGPCALYADIAILSKKPKSVSKLPKNHPSGFARYKIIWNDGAEFTTPQD